MSDTITTIPQATDSPAVAPSEPKPSLLDRSLASVSWLTWEHVAWFALVLLALVLRLYDLGARGMSHDESLHTQYAYYLYNEGRYAHNPMMHGPFRYHLTALGYFLFGDNDFTSRLFPALFGTALVAIMYAFRRYIGRTGAFLAAVLITVSPSLLFHSRYIRDDIFIATFTTLWALFAFRYLETRNKSWLYALVATMGFSFATMENSFITGAIFGGFFVLYALYEGVGWKILTLLVPIIPAGGLGYYYHYIDRDDIALPIVVVGAVIAVALAIYYLVRTEGAWNLLRSSRAADLCVLMVTLVLPFLAPFLHVVLGGEATVFADTAYQSGDLITRMILLVGVCVVLAIGIAWLWFGWLRGRARSADAGTEGAVADTHADRISMIEWLQLMALFWAINILFFTTFFTNARDGLASGVVGSLGYWLAQQHVERGNQPWYYYGFIGSIYEFLPILLTACGFASVLYAFFMRHPIVAVSAADLPRNDASVHTEHADHIRGAFLAFLLMWVAGMWAGYTVAGEKMPWLLTHMALPMCVFGGWWLGRFLRRLEWRKAISTHAVWLILLTPILVLLLVLLVRSLPTGGRSVEAVSSWLRLALSLVAAGGLVYVAVRWYQAAGWRLATTMVAVGVFASLFVLNTRASLMLTFVNYDMATEYLVYAHASPDVKRIMREIQSISERTVGDRNIMVAYDDDASWPLSWYFREYPNARFYGDNPDSTAMTAPIILVSPKNREKVVPYVERDYVKHTYRRIWWPDMDYFNLTWDRIVNAVRDPRQRERLWQIFFFRRHRDTNDFSRFRDLMQWPAREEVDMWVRADLASQIWDLNVTPGLVTQVSNPMADVEQLDVTATAIYQGSFDGMALLTPRDVAVAPDGSRVIADTGNHRIVVLDATGVERLVFGSFCNISEATSTNCIDPDGSGPLQVGDGQFNEPWGVTVDTDGTIYVSDTWNGRIQVFDGEGNFLRKWGSFNSTSGELGDANVLFGPRGIAIDLMGNVVLADTGNKRIIRYLPTGELASQFGGGGVIEGRFDEPTDVAIDPTDGSLFVADAWNRRIQKFAADNAFVAEWPVPGWESKDIYAKPSLTVDADGTVYATDPQYYRVFVFDRDGVLTSTFGRFGTEADRFGFPNGIASDLPNASVLVADADNARIMQFANVTP